MRLFGQNLRSEFEPHLLVAVVVNRIRDREAEAEKNARKNCDGHPGPESLGIAGGGDQLRRRRFSSG